MRIFLLSLLVALTFFACNRDAADATGKQNGDFLAPASAPNPAPAPKAYGDEDLPQMAPSRGDSADEPADKGVSTLTEEEVRAAKRLGPGSRAGLAKQRPVEAKIITPDINVDKRSVSKPATNKPVIDYGRPVVTLARSACHSGDRCRQYTIVLTADRRLILEPKWNMDQKGTHVRQLTAAEYRTLTAAMEATEPSDLQASYPADLSTVPADLQSVSITYADVFGAPKRVSLHQQGPDEVIEFMSLLEAWVDKDGWMKMAQ